MPVTTRKAKPQAKNYIAEDTDFGPSDFEDDTSTFAKVFGADSEEEADTDYRRKAKPKSRKTSGRGGRKSLAARRQNPGRAPSLPPMSDDEDIQPGKHSELGEYLDLNFDSLTEPATYREVTQPNVKARQTNAEIPKVIKIQLADSEGKGTATINLNLADLILRNQKALSITNGHLSADSDEVAVETPLVDNDETLVGADPPKHRGKRLKTLHDAEGETLKARSTKKGFTDLPYELRIGIYRRILVKDGPLEFASQKGFCRSSQFLRTCKLVSEEGSAVMYGENAFHFSRTPATRGAFYEGQWKEIGYKDVRRFLNMIGPANIALMKYITFDLRDAAPSLTPYLDEEERRCVNDPILHHIFSTIGANAMLEKLWIEFDLRRAVSRTDYHFLKALTSMKCHEFKHAVMGYWERRRMPPKMLQDLKKVMVIKKEVDDDVDLSKKKSTSPNMKYSLTESSNRRLY